jgi:hypothetical protein
MGPRVWVVAVISATTLIVAWTASAAPAGISCRPGPGTTTIARSSSARIFSASDGNDYACLYSSGKVRYLSSTEHFEYRLVRFAGPYVAFVQNIEGGDDHIGDLNLRTGRLRNFRIASPVGNSICPGAEALVLKPDGAIAWIGTNFLPAFSCSNPPAPVIEVRRRDRRGLRILDSSGTIALHSLRLTGSTLKWVDAGQTKTSSLL